MLDQDEQDVEMLDAVRRWKESGGTGASAGSIAAHLAGYGEQTGVYPRDAGDFGRCEVLLDAVPGLRAMLGQMAEVNAYWAALVPQWDAIRAAPDQTAVIRAVIAPIEAEDPAHVQLGEGVSMRVGIGPKPRADAAPSEHRAGPRMKETDADREVRDGAYRVTAAELRQFVERYERLEAEKKDIADQQKEVMASAKGRGYDVKVLRKVIALRKRDRDEIAEEEAVLEMYREALGM